MLDLNLPIDDSTGYLLPDLNNELFLQEDDIDEEVGLQAQSQTYSNNENMDMIQDDISSDLNVQGEQAENNQRRRWQKGNHTSNDQRRAIYEMLLEKSVDGKLAKTTTRIVASHFSVGIKTVQRIWNRAKECEGYVDVSHRMHRTGPKKIQIDMNQIRAIPLRQRTTLRDLSEASLVSKTTLYRRLKSGDMRRHSNSLKPSLKEDNKVTRLRFCLSMLDLASIQHQPTFVGMYNIVHIDEKWFYMTKKSENYYLLPDEEDPGRTCKSKNFIEKVMFLTAIARPRFDTQGNEIFSGKIGVYPLVTTEPAKRSSVNRVAGTLETKPITSVTREVIKYFMIEKVLPDIREKWPREDSGQLIYIQQDNAKTHIQQNDHEFLLAAAKDGFDIRLMFQPSNSPDLNILDLGFFRAIQSLQHKESPSNVDELVNAVVKAFEIFSSRKSNFIFLTLQMCMIEIMKRRGCNKYRIPHMKKSVLEKRGQLPQQIKCDLKIVEDVLQFLHD